MCKGTKQFNDETTHRHQANIVLRACLILYDLLTSKFNLWLYVGVMECRSLFSVTVTLISGVTCADPEGAGGPEPSLINHKNIGFLSNTGPDPL